MSAGFYNAAGLHAPNFVKHKDFELNKDTKGESHGWKWYDTIEEAAAELGFDLPVEEAEVVEEETNE